MSVQQQLQFDASGANWFDADQLDSYVAPDPVGGWLRERGLLTQRLRASCKEHFRLEVLADTGLQAPADDVHLREVLMCCGDRPCIYARTLIPAATAKAHPWLRSLGNEPLGERLQDRDGVKRSDFRFAALGAGTPEARQLLPEDLANSTTDILWARSSTFSIGAHEISVTEIFLPGILGCESATESPTSA